MTSWISLDIIKYMGKNCNILGIRVDLLTQDEVLNDLRGFVNSKKPHQICTVNTEFVMAARKNPEFAKAINESDISLADGAGIVLAAKLLNQPKPPRITGVDFTYALAEESAKQGYKMFLLGGRDGVGGKAAEKLQAKNPGLHIAGVYEGSPDDSNVIPTILNANPQILLVAWGAPKQDIWIYKHKNELNVPVMMGVGGTFDFITGKQKRAPKWMRSCGLEWLWRLLREPSRWKRQLALPKMFIIIFAKKLKLIS